MEIIYGKTLTEQESVIIQDVAKDCDITFDTARLLFYRGINTTEKAKAFLSPGKKGFHNPFTLDGMADAVQRITSARDNHQTVLIFGDYDADGVCATTILYHCLEWFKVKVIADVPEREEGYGLSLEKMQWYKQQHNVSLLITVDCGISEHDKIEQIKSLGVDVIVTDHHELPEILPDCIKINPKIKNQQYPFDGLCGAGVAYKLGYALIGEKADELLDVAALATVADSMDLVGENRDIVVEGLKIFNSKNVRPQFKCLLGDSTRQITAQTLAYTIGPRINAGGRMGDAHTALNLFLTEDQNKIFELSAKLGEYNYERQTECDNIYKEARNKIISEGVERDNVILVCNESWGAGFIGIVAAKLVEDFNKPVIVFAGHDGYYKGSARSVEGVNIHDAISACKQHLIGFGGHSQAAGVSVEKEKFQDFRVAINQYIKTIEKAEKTILVEWNIDKEFPHRFAKEIDRLEPFGVGNRRPLFTTEVGAVESLPLKAGSPHFSYKTSALEMLDFYGADNVFTLSLPINKKIVFEVNVSSYKNQDSIKGYVRTIVAYYGDYSGVSLEIAENELKKIPVNDGASVQTISSGVAGDGYGTMYAVSNPKTLAKLEYIKTLPVCLFTPEEKSAIDCIVVSPTSIPEGYNTVIYADKPLSYVNSSAKNYLINEQCGYDFVEELNVDREIFAKYFAILRSLSGKRYTSATAFVKNNDIGENPYQAIFTILVFVELGIFTVDNGRFIYNEKTKNPLTNSLIYSKIYSLKG